MVALMSRVCLECGTPKVPMKKTCLVCDAATLTHEGDERDTICNRCAYQRGAACGWTETNASRIDSKANRFLNHRVDDLIERTQRYAYWCPDFQQRRDATTVVSPNPLSPQDVRDIKLARELPFSFWLAHDLWEGIDDPRKQMFWDKPEPATISATTVVTGAVVLSGLLALLPRLFIKKSPPAPADPAPDAYHAYNVNTPEKFSAALRDFRDQIEVDKAVTQPS
jgi:hypothetical protein